LRALYAFMLRSGIAQDVEGQVKPSIAMPPTMVEAVSPIPGGLGTTVSPAQPAATSPTNLGPMREKVSEDQIAMIKRAMKPRADYWKPIWAYGADESGKLGLTIDQWNAAINQLRQLAYTKVHSGKLNQTEMNDMVDLDQKLSLFSELIQKHMESLKQSGKYAPFDLAQMKFLDLPQEYNKQLSGPKSLSYQRGSGRPMSVEEYAKYLAKQYRGRISPEDLQGFVDAYSSKMQSGSSGEGSSYGFGSGTPMSSPPITDEYLDFTHPLWTQTGIGRFSKKLYSEQMTQYQYSSDRALQLATGFSKLLQEAGYEDSRASVALSRFLGNIIREIDWVAQKYVDASTDRRATGVFQAANMWKTILNNILKVLREGQGDVQQAQKRY
jgi:hypothetical protein